jgi:hypothetical protein
MVSAFKIREQSPDVHSLICFTLYGYIEFPYYILQLLYVVLS